MCSVLVACEGGPWGQRDGAGCPPRSPSRSRIRASPAALESTSHVLAIGMDLFYTRVSPAKSYDLLGDDFSYWLVLTTTSGLVVATFVAKALAKRRSLALAWS